MGVWTNGMDLYVATEVGEVIEQHAIMFGEQPDENWKELDPDTMIRVWSSTDHGTTETVETAREYAARYAKASFLATKETGNGGQFGWEILSLSREPGE